MPVGETLAFASEDLTFAGQPADTETVSIGGKTYTFQAALTDADGNVAIGADLEESIDNLVAAVNLGDGAGSAYAASMTRNEHAWAEKQSGTVMRAYAAVGGAIGNNVAVAETLATVGSAWGGSSLSGGTGNILKFFEDLLALNQLNSGVIRAITDHLTPYTD